MRFSERASPRVADRRLRGSAFMAQSIGQSRKPIVEIASSTAKVLDNASELALDCQNSDIQQCVNGHRSRKVHRPGLLRGIMAGVGCRDRELQESQAMRTALIQAVMTLLLASSVSLTIAPVASAAEGCTGPECQSQPGPTGGHQCEHEKREQITS